MHSRKALDNIYPGLVEILPLYYGQADRNDPKFANVTWDWLDSLDLLKGHLLTNITYITIRNYRYYL